MHDGRAYVATVVGESERTPHDAIAVARAVARADDGQSDAAAVCQSDADAIAGADASADALAVDGRADAAAHADALAGAH